jgi:hypothetical protein
MSRDRKRVLITVSPELIAGKRCSTLRSLVTALDKHTDLLLLPIDGYDFDTNSALAYRRVPGGTFEKVGTIHPSADLWIVYTDGYYLDSRQIGFKRRIDYLSAQLQFHEYHLSGGHVATMLNTPESERNTLKNWLAQLASLNLPVIPTFTNISSLELHDLMQKFGTLVAKPHWGGAGLGVFKLSNDKEVRKFLDTLDKTADTELADYCFQVFCTGYEKRLWFTGSDFVGGRYCFGRGTPWSDRTDDSYTNTYDQRDAEFASDLKNAQTVWNLSKLSIGSVDFIGDRINEINGCGTVFTHYHGGWNKIIDARPALVDFVLSVIR